MIKRLEQYLFLLLTPIYMGIIYYKTIMNPNQYSLMIITGIILFVFSPFQFLLKDKKEKVDIFDIFKNEQIMDYFKSIYIFVAVAIVSVFISSFLNNSYFWIFFIIIYISWYFISEKFILIFLELELKSQIKLIGIFLFFVLTVYLSGYSELSYHSSIKINTDNNFADSTLYSIDLSLNFIGLIFNIIKIFFISTLAILLLFPTLFMVLLENIDLSAFFSGIASIISIIFFVFLFLLIAFSDWISSILIKESIESTLRNISILMMFITFLGVLYQLKIFISYFTNNKINIQKYSILLISIFYLSMFADIILNSAQNLVTVHNTTKEEERELQLRKRFRFMYDLSKKEGLESINISIENERRLKNIDLKNKVDKLENIKGIKRVIKD